MPTDPTLASLGTLVGVAAFVIIAMSVLKRVLWPKPEDSDAQDRFAPLLSIGVGIFVAIFYALFSGVTTMQEWGQALVTGFFGGASAVGLYTTTKRAIDQ